MQNMGFMTPAALAQNRLQKQTFFQNLVLSGNQERLRKQAIEAAKKEQEKAQDKAQQGGIWGGVLGAIGGGIAGFVTGGPGGALLGAAKGGMQGFQTGRQTGDPASGALLATAQGAMTGFEEKKRQDALLRAAKDKAFEQETVEKQLNLKTRAADLAEKGYEAELRKIDLMEKKNQNEFITEQLKAIRSQAKNDKEFMNKSENFLVKLIDPQLTDFMQVVTAKNKVEAALNRGTAAGDMAAIFNYMKILDPGSTVREGEFATAKNAGGVDDRIRNLYNQALSGVILTPEQRLDFGTTAKSLFKAEQETFRSRYNQVKTMAENQGLNLVNVFGGITPDLLNIDLGIEQNPEPTKNTPSLIKQAKEAQRVAPGPKPVFFGRKAEEEKQENQATEYLNRFRKEFNQ